MDVINLFTQSRMQECSNQACYMEGYLCTEQCFKKPVM